MACFPCTKKKIGFLLFILMLETVDFITDWLFYFDVSHKEKGLVYGPPESSTVTAVLCFSIIGTFFYLWEIVNLFCYERNINTGRKYKPVCLLDPDTVSAIVLWLEDIPQIIINVLIARCHEEPISYWQWVKASLALLDVVVKIIMVIHSYCKKNKKIRATKRLDFLGTTVEKEWKAWSKRWICVYAMLFIGNLILACGASAVFVFTQTTRDADGGIEPNQPISAVQDKFNDRKYFQNSSVFLHPPLSVVEVPNSKLIRLFDIDDFILQKQDMIHFRLTYIKESSSTFKLILHKVDGAGGAWKLTGCFGFNDSILTFRNALPHEEANCSRNDFFTVPLMQVFLTFRFIRPETSTLFRKLIFGDIHYNIKVKIAGRCTEIDLTSPGILADYHRLKPTTVEKAAKVYHLLPADGDRFRFYTAGKDMIPVQEAWKTGFWECPMSGRRQPLLDIGLQVPVWCD